MKRIFVQTAKVFAGLCVITIVVSNCLFSVQAAPPTSAFGVWDRGSSFDPKEYPFLKGCSFLQKWADVEKQPGKYDWSVLDKAMETAVSRKQYIFLSLGVGPDAPEWIYTQGVPNVYCSDQIHDSWPVYPYYPSQAYKTYFQRLITEFGKHIHSYPKEVQERIVFIQVKTGCTGDECAYKGNAIEKKYELPTKSTEWREFRLWVFDLFIQTFQKEVGQPSIALMFNNVTPECEEGGKEPGFTEEWNWVMKNAQGGVGVKIAGSARGHHLSEEKNKIETWQPRLIATEGTPLFARSEMDQTWQRAMFAVNLPLTFYWAAITGLQNGQSIWDISSGALNGCKELGFDYSFYFFNKYAGQIYPNTATDAFCALHKGLDAADTKSYPEEKYGQATPKNVDRMMKICALYSKQGATVDDKDALLLGQVRQRDTQKGLNDVGWNIWSDNYSRFLYQIDADQTSIPLWRVGGPITKRSSIYSRFARGFEHASGKDAMYFKLHEGFSQGNEPKIVTVTIVWYDSIKGSSWKLVYDAGKKQMKTAFTITGKGDKHWHHQTITINDAVLQYKGIKGSDFALLNTDPNDDIFSLIEVHKGKLDAPVMLPPTDYKISDKKPMPPKADKAEKEKKAEKKQKKSKEEELE